MTGAAETLLFVGVVEHRELAVRTALERGARLVVVDDADALSLRFADVALPVDDVLSAEQVLAAVAGLTERPDGVVTFYDELLGVTADIARSFGCPALPARTALLARNKVAQRRALDEAGVPQPAWRTCDTPAQAADAAAELGFPVCVKVADQSGSIGKKRADDAGSLAGIVAEVDAQRLDRTVPLLVEEWVRGEMHTVDAFVAGGELTPMSVSRTTIAPGEYPVVTGQLLPVGGPAAEEAVAVAASAVRAMGVADASVHVEVFRTPSGPRLVEVNVRTGGDFVMDLVHLAAGANPYHVVFDLAVGRRPTWSPKWTGAACVRFVLPGANGYLAGLTGLDAVRTSPGFAGVGLEQRPGARLGPVTDNGGRLAWVRAVGATWQEAEARAAVLADRVALGVRLDREDPW